MAMTNRQYFVTNIACTRKQLKREQAKLSLYQLLMKFDVSEPQAFRRACSLNFNDLLLSGEFSKDEKAKIKIIQHSVEK